MNIFLKEDVARGPLSFSELVALCDNGTNAGTTHRFIVHVFNQLTGQLEDVYEVDRNYYRIKQNLTTCINQNFKTNGSPYYYYHDFITDVTLTTSPFCSTACTDGCRMWINPEFAETLVDMQHDEMKKAYEETIAKSKNGKITTSQYVNLQSVVEYKLIVYLILHECFHQFFRHAEYQLKKLGRNVSRTENYRCNIAMDMEINRDIERWYPVFKGATKACGGAMDDKPALLRSWSVIYDDLFKNGQMPQPPMPPMPNQQPQQDNEPEVEHKLAPSDYEAGWKAMAEAIESGAVDIENWDPFPVDSAKLSPDCPTMNYLLESTTSPITLQGVTVPAGIENIDDFYKGCNDLVEQMLKRRMQQGGGGQPQDKQVEYDNLRDLPEDDKAPEQEGSGKGKSSKSSDNNNKKSNNKSGSQGQSGDEDNDSDNQDGESGDSDNQNGSQSGKQSNSDKQGNQNGQSGQSGEDGDQDGDNQNGGQGSQGNQNNQKGDQQNQSGGGQSGQDGQDKQNVQQQNGGGQGQSGQDKQNSQNGDNQNGQGGQSGQDQQQKQGQGGNDSQGNNNQSGQFGNQNGQDKQSGNQSGQNSNQNGQGQDGQSGEQDGASQDSQSGQSSNSNGSNGNNSLGSPNDASAKQGGQSGSMTDKDSIKDRMNKQTALDANSLQGDIISKEVSRQIAKFEGIDMSKWEDDSGEIERIRKAVEKNRDKIINTLGGDAGKEMAKALDEIEAALSESIVDWQSILYDIFTDAGIKPKKEDKYNMTKIATYHPAAYKKNKRVNEPLKERNAADVFYLIDASGSMFSNKGMHGRCFSEILEIEQLPTLNIHKSALTFFADDIDVSRIRTWVKEDDIDDKLALMLSYDENDVGGGTGIARSVRHVVALEDLGYEDYYTSAKPKTVIIVYTDGEEWGSKWSELRSLDEDILEALVFIIVNNESQLRSVTAELIENGIEPDHIVPIDETKYC